MRDEGRTQFSDTTFVKFFMDTLRSLSSQEEFKRAIRLLQIILSGCVVDNWIYAGLVVFLVPHLNTATHEGYP
jgi:hypothetical protein